MIKFASNNENLAAFGNFEIQLVGLSSHVVKYTFEMVKNFSIIVPDPYRVNDPVMAFKDYKFILSEFEKAVGLHVVSWQIIQGDLAGLWHLEVVHRAPSQDDTIYQDRWWQALKRKSQRQS